jgi:hypothetical protein
MRKAIKLKVTLWIEGEDEPAHDFAAYTIQAVRDIIAAHARLYPGLKVTVRKVAEDTSNEEEDTG